MPAPNLSVTIAGIKIPDSTLAKDTTAIITATPAQRTVGSVTSLPASTVCTLARTHNGNANTCTRRQQRQGSTTRTHEVSTTAVSKYKAITPQPWATGLTGRVNGISNCDTPIRN